MSLRTLRRLAALVTVTLMVGGALAPESLAQGKKL